MEALKLLRPASYVGGVLIITLSLLMLVMAGYSWLQADGEHTAFLQAGAVCASLGVVLSLAGYSHQGVTTARHLYLITSLSWVSLALLSALPLWFSASQIELTDAIFEAVSGITTTGSTALTHLQTLAPSLLLWRSLLQWIGGLGVIGMAVSILPFLRIGGMRLFQTESSDWSEKTLPRFQSLARSTFVMYLVVTIVCAASYYYAGMTGFDAINHAMTTVSTGGYATDDQSMARFNDSILWISVIFMMMGGLPFTLLVALIWQRKWTAWQDQQARAFFGLTVAAASVLTIYRYITSDEPMTHALTYSVFHTVSIITTTGYAASDYSTWGQFSVVFFFLLTFIGGCSGSTAGGMKVFRFQISWMFLKQQIYKLVHPRGVFTLRYNNRVVTEDIMVSAVAFTFLFLIVLSLTALMLSLTGLDLVTSLTAAATALTNVGPGLGDTIGPAGNFAALHDSAKYVLSLAMIMGRLEMMTIMVILMPVFWRG